MASEAADRLPAVVHAAATGRWRVRFAVAAAAVVGLLAGAAGSAWADDNRVYADPPAGAVLSKAPTGVTLAFAHDVQPELSHVAVFDRDGSEIGDGTYSQPASDRVHLPVTIDQDGDYTVAYHVTFPDGTSTTDAYRFSVGTGVPPVALDAATRQASTDAVARHAHQIDGLSATLLVLDGLVLCAVLGLLWLRPRDGRPMSFRPRDSGPTPDGGDPDRP
ncbi:copper resistance CopC family protein [Micromonospora sp. LOL_023]|uniref:copper resistance CopC family protein n=1 Tax=Micromonospora sp. LOL_023 TaxID=3345418 RepID=UPI003A873D84